MTMGDAVDDVWADKLDFFLEIDKRDTHTHRESVSR